MCGLIDLTDNMSHINTIQAISHICNKNSNLALMQKGVNTMFMV